jgi:c(7)-type cytochrome triheme protein
MSSVPSAPSRPPAPALLRGGRWLAGLAALLLFATPILTAPVPALFSHWGHNSQHCYSCHPSVFPQAPLGFTHQDMREGRYCGSCHDGQAAKAIRSMGCEVCHAPR